LTDFVCLYNYEFGLSLCKIDEEITCCKGDYVLAAYERIGYTGHVLEDDVSDNSLHIDFMVESGKVVNRQVVFLFIKLP
jgi:hypothetical protein